MPAEGGDAMRADGIRTIRLFLLIEGVSFLLAALVHSGMLIEERLDPGAAIAESVIAIALLGAFGLAALSLERTRTLGLAAQGFALAGTLIGTYLTAIVELGTVPDVVYHVTMLLVLSSGLVVAAKSDTGDAMRTDRPA
jgi:hypothetical protein